MLSKTNFEKFVLETIVPKFPDIPEGDRQDTRKVLRFAVDSAFRTFSSRVAADPDAQTSADVRAEYAKPVKGALDMYNQYMTACYCDAARVVGYKKAILSYLEDQTTKGLKLKVSSRKHDGKTTLTYSIDVASVPVSYADFVETCLTEKSFRFVLDACTILADNIVRKLTGEDTDAFKGRLLSESYNALAHSKGWDYKAEELSNTKLVKELGELAAHLFPEEVCLKTKFIVADVKYICHAIVTARGSANKSGRIVVANERKIVDTFFRAVYTRYYGQAYEFVLNTNAANPTMTPVESKPESK